MMSNVHIAHFAFSCLILSATPIIAQINSNDATPGNRVGLPKPNANVSSAALALGIPPEPWNLIIDNYHYYAHGYREPHMNYDSTVKFMEQFILDELKEVSKRPSLFPLKVAIDCRKTPEPLREKRIQRYLHAVATYIPHRRCASVIPIRTQNLNRS